MNLLVRQKPLAAQAAEAGAKKKECRVFEQYLINILRELLRSRGETQTEMHLYTRGKRSPTTLHIHN